MKRVEGELEIFFGGWSTIYKANSKHALDHQPVPSF